MGRVVLIGAGPGDSGLMTLRGRELLASADVVLFDRLVGPGVLAMIPQTAEQVDVGKNAGDHPVPQEEINQLILAYAQKGLNVARLKGGDPYLFGRGAEELEAIIAEGIDFEVVPGVTSAIAAAAYGGIPVTHRDYSSSLHIITARPKKGEQSEIDFKSLINLKGTIVFMMGVGEIPNLVEGLLSAGINKDTPVALIENGTTSRQRRIISTVGAVVTDAAKAEIKPPSLFVVGEVCQLGEKLDWFSRRPLFGTTVLVTRPKSTASRLSYLLKEEGAGVVEYPCIYTKAIEMTKSTAESLKSYSWLVFTSALGVELFFRGLGQNQKDVREIGAGRIAAVGTETAKALTDRGLQVDYIPEIFDGEHLGAGLGARVAKGEKVLLYRSAIGGDELPRMLAEKGAAVTDHPAYETFYENPANSEVAHQLTSGEIDLVTFTSASTVHGFVASTKGLELSLVTAVCIGDRTGEIAREYGMKTHISAGATLKEMVEKILELRKKGGE